MGGDSDVRIDGFEIEGEIGRGGFGVVFRARQLAFGRLAAVKVLLPDSGADEVARRFAQECRAVGSLRPHPNIVTVYSTGTTTDGRPYLAMQYLGGGTLSGRVPLAAGAVAALGARLADGLGVAHAGGVIHRDVKPANILFDADAEPVLVDFGISAVLGEGSTTGADIALSVAYAPPEVLRGESAGVAADIYALGATLFAAVIGRSPFADADGVTPIATLAGRILADPIEDLRPAGVPDALCAVIERCLAKDPARRYTSMVELRTALLPIEGDAVLHSPAELWGMPTTTVGALDLAPGEYDHDKTSLRGGVTPARTGRQTGAPAGTGAATRRDGRRGRFVAAVAASVLLAAGAAAITLRGDDHQPATRAVAGTGSPTSGSRSSNTSGPTSSSPGTATVPVPIPDPATGAPTSATSVTRPRSSAPAANPVAPPAARSSATRRKRATRSRNAPHSSSPPKATVPTNHAPTLTAMPVVHTSELSAVRTAFTASDADGDGVSLSVRGLPLGLSASSSGAVTGTVVAYASGVTHDYRTINSQTFTITVTATDAKGASTTATVAWTVRDTAFRMPNYIGKRGCNGYQGCKESVPNISTLGPRTTTCTVNKSKAVSIVKQSVAAGASVRWGTKMNYVVAHTGCG